MAAPPFDVAAYIATNVSGLTLNVNCFHGIEQAANPPYMPADAVFVAGAPGGAPDRVHSLRYETRYPMLHIRSRAATSAQAETWARAIQNLLQRGLPSGYQDIRALQSEPTPAAEGTSKLAKYTMSYLVTYENDVGAP